MAAVQPKDILFRFGGPMLRQGLLYVPGPGRGPVEVVETFARASTQRFRARDGLTGGLGRKAASGKIAIDYPSGLVDAAGNPVGTVSLEAARTQLVTDPENFGAWSASGTPVRISGQADPFGGTAAYLLNDDDGAVEEDIFQNVTFTGDGEKCFSLFIRQGTATSTEVALFDATAGATRHRVIITWSGGVPSLGTTLGSGTRYPVEAWGGGWYRIHFSAPGVVAANTNQCVIYIASVVASATGTIYTFGANAWDAPFPSSYQGPGESPSANGSLYVPINFGCLAMTIYSEWVERGTKDTPSGRIWEFGASGSSVPRLFLWRPSNAAQYKVRHDPDGSTTVTSGADHTHAFGDRMRAVTQLYPDGSVQLHWAVNSGAYVSHARSAAAFLATKWSDQRFWVGSEGTAFGFAAHAQHLAVRDVHTTAEMETAAA